MRKLASIKLSLESSFRTAAKYVAPPLHRKICENKARFYYKKSQSPDNDYQGSFGKNLSGILAEKFLKEAGHDVMQDDAFVNVLEISGGRAQFMEKTELQNYSADNTPSINA